MKIAVRTDASYLIGTGHVMRCLTIAEQLRDLGNYVFFICKDLHGNLIDLLKDKGFKVRTFQSEDIITDARLSLDAIQDECEDVDWLIVDHYDLDEKWEIVVKKNVNQLFVIDDLANRTHICDLLLDQNFFLNMHERYRDKVPAYCKLMLGPAFAILRNEFYENRRRLSRTHSSCNKLLVFMGGSDSSNETKKVIEALIMANLKGAEVNIIVGASNPKWQELVNTYGSFDRFNFYRQVSNMARFIAAADLAIGAGGSSIWERCFLGLPSFTLIVAENQIRTTEDVASLGATINLGWHESVTSSDIANRIQGIINDSERLELMTKAAFELMGEYTTHGVHAIIKEIYQLSRG